MSIKISARNLGPEMAAPIFFGHLAFFGSFCRKTPVPTKIPPFLGGGGGSGFFRRGGGSADFIFIRERKFSPKFF